MAVDLPGNTRALMPMLGAPSLMAAWASEAVRRAEVDRGRTHGLGATASNEPARSRERFRYFGPDFGPIPVHPNTMPHDGRVGETADSNERPYLAAHGGHELRQLFAAPGFGTTAVGSPGKMRQFDLDTAYVGFAKLADFPTPCQRHPIQSGAPYPHTSSHRSIMWRLVQLRREISGSTPIYLVRDLWQSGLL